MNRRTLAPILIVLAGFSCAGLLIATGPRVEPRAPELVAPLVRVLDVEPQTLRLRVNTHGTVAPRTESELVPEVSGTVVWASPALVSGGFFAAGDPLLRVDPLDYEVALERARAALARAESEAANARTDNQRQLDLARQNVASEAQRDNAANQLRVAEAALREARASLSRAERDLARTEISAPYEGRVRSERVDVGQFVNRGTPFATIYAVDYAEVRLPVHDEQLAFLDLPLSRNRAELAVSVPVTLRARFAGREHEWQGEVVRTEGELDPRTRMVNVVARVTDPYQSGDAPPLSVGLFVEAEILGSEAEGIVVLPRSALRAGNQVLVVDTDEKLQFRDVEVLRMDAEQVLVQGGLERGERVCVSPLESATEGMVVRVRSEPDAAVAASPEPADAS